MNKLRKPPHHAPSSSSPSKHLTQHGSVIPSSAVSESRTMMYARAPIVSPPSKKAMVTTVKSLTATSASEQYWAARALTAETLLSARLAHQSEMAQAIETAEEKRAREVYAIQQYHDERHTRLERLIVLLLTCLITFAAVVLYLLARSQNHTHSTRWSMPSHFTIPILSPFASVVEHETSVVNVKLLTICVICFSVLTYAAFRYWLTHARLR